MKRGEYAALAEAQHHVCAICLNTRKLVVDHCHATGVVRGLLCKPCNSAIGFLGESAEACRAAAMYLRRTAAKRTA